MRPFNLIEAQLGAKVRTKNGTEIVEVFVSKRANQPVIGVTAAGNVLSFNEDGVYGFDEKTRDQFAGMDLVIVE